MKRRRRTTPNGFTLIELLIVISIIGVLAAMTIPLVGNVTNQARRAATKTTIKKAHELLDSRINGFEREFKKRFLRTYNRKYSQSRPADILIRKAAFREMFPHLLTGQRLVYLGNSGNLPNSVGTARTPADNSEALLYMLTKMAGFDGSSGDEGNFLGGEIKDTDGDDVMEFVDAWGQPIRFYRWPTQLVKDYAAARVLIRTLPALAADRNKDGDDPLGRLTTLNPKNFHDLSTMHPPLIVSGGRDKLTGLFEAYDTTRSGHLAKPNGNPDELDDNITNLNNQAGDE